MTGTLTETAGETLVATLEGTFKKYLAMDEGLALVLALWTIATHAFECFDAFPYLTITSPTKRCGKTRLAEIVDLFSNNGLRTVGASPPAIFRMIQIRESNGGTVTLIMDEAEVLGTKSERSEQLREILNAGYRRGQYVLRCERKGENGFEPQQFNVYCPKMLVLIGNLHETLADRCIPIAMRRRKLGEQVERFFHLPMIREAKRFKNELEKWLELNLSKIRTRYRRGDLKFLNDREAELWLPIFIVCAVAAPNRLDELKAIALRISSAKQADEPAEFGVLLLGNIREVFDRNQGTPQSDRISTADLLGYLNANDESPWPRWSRGQGLDARGLARLLKAFGISPHNLRLDDNTVVKGYERLDFEDAWATYLQAVPSTTPIQRAQIPAE